MFSDINLFDPVVLLALFILIVFLYLVFKKIFTKKRVYKPKGPNLLSFTERKFFENLASVVGPTLYVCPKVRIADLVRVDLPENHKDFWVSFNKISQKHVDFVVVKRTDFSPLLIVELDGGSHKESERSLRDILVDRVFKDADIPVLHYEPQRFYERSNLKEAVFGAIQNYERT